MDRVETNLSGSDFGVSRHVDAGAGSPVARLVDDKRVAIPIRAEGQHKVEARRIGRSRVNGDRNRTESIPAAQLRNRNR